MLGPSTLVPWSRVYRVYAHKSYLGGAIWPVPPIALLVVATGRVRLLA
jgi:hypothetical protein